MRLPLTPRQREIVRAVLNGRHEAEIATQLGISRRTVKQHLNSTYLRLGIEDHWNKKLRMVYLLWQDGMIDNL